MLALLLSHNGLILCELLVRPKGSDSVTQPLLRTVNAHSDDHAFSSNFRRPLRPRAHSRLASSAQAIANHIAASGRCFQSRNAAALSSKAPASSNLKSSILCFAPLRIPIMFST